MDPRFKHPYCCLVAGPSGSGKTSFIYNIITNLNDMILPTPDKVLYCYKEWQPLYDELQSVWNVEFVEGLPDTDSFTAMHTRLVIIDDLMDEADSRITRLFTRESHHRGISVMLITQNLFSNNKEQRTINLNAHYIVLFKNPRDASQISHLASQMYPGKTSYMKEAYRLSTIKPFGYLLIDLKQETDEKFRLRTNIFPNDQQIVYLPKN